MHPVSNVNHDIHTTVNIIIQSIFPQKISTAYDVINQKVNKPSLFSMSEHMAPMWTDMQHISNIHI